MHTQGGYLTSVMTTHNYVFDIKDDDIYWCGADIGWVTGHSYIVYGPLANGVTGVMCEGAPNFPDNDRLWKIIEDYRRKNYVFACVKVSDVTLAKGAQALAAMGAGPIFAGATHAIFSGKARQNLEESSLEQVIVTNTVPIPDERHFDKLRVLSIAPLVASALRAVFEDSSVSELFGGDNQL